MTQLLNAAASYRENASQGVSPLGLVVLLYERALQDMRHTAAAMQSGDTEGRVRHINHALLVLQELQGRLDFEHGGQAARQLEQFYNLIRGKLLEAHIRNSRNLLQQQIAAMEEIRDSWALAERQSVEPSTSERPAADRPPLPETESSLSSGTWQA